MHVKGGNVTAVIVRVFDPAIGADRELWIYKRAGQIVVQPRPPSTKPDAQTIRLAETRLAFAEGARRARRARGFIGDLPASSVITGETTRELMREATVPRLNAKQASRKYWASLLEPRVLENVAEMVGTKRPARTKSP